MSLKGPVPRVALTAVPIATSSLFAPTTVLTAVVPPVTVPPICAKAAPILIAPTISLAIPAASVPCEPTTIVDWTPSSVANGAG